MLAQLPLLSNPSGQAVITGSGFVLTVTGIEDLNSNRTVYFTSPAVIAQRVHGRIIYSGQ